MSLKLHFSKYRPNQQTTYYRALEALSLLNLGLEKFADIDTIDSWVLLVEACNFGNKHARNLAKTVTGDEKRKYKDIELVLGASKNALTNLAIRNGVTAFSGTDDDGKKIIYLESLQAGRIGLHQIRVEYDNTFKVTPLQNNDAFTGFRRQGLSAILANSVNPKNITDNPSLTALSYASTDPSFAAHVLLKMKETDSNLDILRMTEREYFSPRYV